MVTTPSSFDTALQNAGIARNAASTAAGAAAKQPSKSLGEMGPSDFISLLTAQMKNQDPFEPVDNSQMVAQMAQFSSLAGISEMGTTLKSIATKLSGGASDAAAYVGKTVLTEGKTAYPRSGGGFAGAIELDEAAAAVSVTIKDAAGSTVKTIALPAQAAGTVAYDWDGKSDDGTDVTNAPFTVSVAAASNGKPVTARTLVWAPVTSVAMPQGADPVLDIVGVGKVAATAVRAIA